MRSSKKGSKLEVPVGAVYALLAALSLICVTMVTLAIAGLDDGPERLVRKEPEFDPTPHLYIEEVFFQGRESEDITVEIYIYITNDGTKEAQDVVVHIWPVVGESNIATDMQEVDLGNIGINQTSMKKVSIVLKAGETLSVELLVFESSMMVLKGRAEVSTSGQGGGNYQNTEVRGTSGDGDYDGMPDDWERYYGLDPNDPSDAGSDRDGDGVSNLMEYRLNRDPTATPAGYEGGSVWADDDDDGDWDMEAEESGGSGAIMGAGLFLVLIIGLIVILIIAAVRASNRKDRDKAAWNQPPQMERQVPDGVRDRED